ncbi:AfsR/SARP family transcriptional regulator [Streptacidiphilus cavernicola]|uniref:BTAD domain-containing putative transcriptional regulator n=1 Tax=Streptacidiphilus cavernicola TaxID=3342716 RepID=A0ABV6VPC5_9ACTN
MRRTAVLSSRPAVRVAAALTAAESPYLAFLGPVRAWSGGRPLLTGSPRQRAVLAVLALRAGQEVSRAELVDGLYGEGTHAADADGWAAEELRRDADRLRTLLGGPSWPDQAASLLHRTDDGYLLDIAPGRVDGIAFERLVGAAHALREGSPSDSADLLARAFALWRGTPLSGLPGPFAAAERIRLQALHEVASDLWREHGTPAPRPPHPDGPPLAW